MILPGSNLKSNYSQDSLEFFGEPYEILQQDKCQYLRDLTIQYYLFSVFIVKAFQVGLEQILYKKNCTLEVTIMPKRNRCMKRVRLVWKQTFFDFLIRDCTNLRIQPISIQLTGSLNLKTFLLMLCSLIIIKTM